MAKRIRGMLPSFYIVYLKDSDGDLWTFHKPTLGTCRPLHLKTAENLQHFDRKEIAAVRKELEAKPASFWNEALEDYDDESNKLTLNKKSLKYQCMTYTSCTMTKEDFEHDT